MAEESKQTFDLLTLTTWCYERRKSLLGVAAIAAAIALVVGLYSWHSSARTSAANAAFDAIQLPNSPSGLAPSNATLYLKLADDYPASGAAARSLILAGGILFDAGKYTEAQAAFDKYLATYRDYPFTSTALFGVAASLDAQGKVPDAVQRYETIINRPQDYVTIPAKSALGRLYVQQNKPEMALRQYVELLQFGAQDSWANEAQNQVQALLLKHPELRKLLQSQQGAPGAPPPAPAPRS